MPRIPLTSVIPLLATCLFVPGSYAQQAAAYQKQQAEIAAEAAAVYFPNEEQQEKVNREKEQAVELLSIDSKLVRGKPFSADTTTDSIQTLSDGNRIQQHIISKFYRDSSGRTRREQTFGNIDPSNPSPHEVKIFVDDPVAGAAYVFDPGEKVAMRVRRSKKFLDEGQNQSIPSVRSLPRLDESRDIVQQDLGTKTIDGIQCTGTQQTITIPAGQVGNDQPIAIVTETWFAPSLSVIVQSTTNDPRFGQTTYQLHNIQLGEQPLALFEPPAGYKLEGVQTSLKARPQS
jgi:hypothetical protein